MTTNLTTSMGTPDQIAAAKLTFVCPFSDLEHDKSTSAPSDAE